MDYKELCKKAFSSVRETYPCSDHETALKNVKERAKNMKTDENVRQTNIREFPADLSEPKKSTKIIHAIAGIAGTAAVLTGAIFGLNWLNEHGGLREGGIETDTRAGSHDTAVVNDTEQLSENTPDIPAETTGSSAESTLDIESSIDEAEVPSIQESFTELYETNNDIVGWIRIGSTDDPIINYPVVQAEDNDYYLTHNFNKEEEQRGAIFADFRNNFDKGLLSGNTVLYGHNLWNGEMFAKLSRYYDDRESDDDLSFYKENPTVTFNTLYENAEWKVFACVLFNKQEEKGEVYPYDQILDFADAEEFNSFVIDITDRSVLWTDVDLTYGDSILTLSTFYYPFGPDTDTRVAVFARKVRPGESSEVDVSKAIRNPDPLKFEYQYQIEGGSWDGSIWDKSHLLSYNQ